MYEYDWKELSSGWTGVDMFLSLELISTCIKMSISGRLIMSLLCTIWYAAKSHDSRICTLMLCPLLMVLGANLERRRSWLRNVTPCA